MSGSDWCKLAKVVGLASAAFLILSLVYFTAYAIGTRSGYYEGQQERAASQYPSDTQRIVDDCFRLPTRTQTSECVSQAYEASRENQRAEKDLTAQRNMADWAWWVVVIGLLQFFATIATLGFVKLNLDAALEAVKDTGKATEAMERQNGLTERIQRPWVGIELNPKLFARQGNSFRVEIDIACKNLGQLPAKNYQLGLQMQWTATGRPDEIEHLFSILRPSVTPDGRVPRGGVGTVDPRQDRVHVRQPELAG